MGLLIKRAIFTLDFKQVSRLKPKLLKKRKQIINNIVNHHLHRVPMMKIQVGVKKWRLIIVSQQQWIRPIICIQVMRFSLGITQWWLQVATKIQIIWVTRIQDSIALKMAIHIINRPFLHLISLSKLYMIKIQKLTCLSILIHNLHNHKLFYTLFKTFLNLMKWFKRQLLINLGKLKKQKDLTQVYKKWKKSVSSFRKTW